MRQWRPYCFNHYQSCNVTSLRFIAPGQPRLDHSMFYNSFGSRCLFVWLHLWVWLLGLRTFSPEVWQFYDERSQGSVHCRSLPRMQSR